MDEFLDLFSKRLASAVSRRQMLGIASRTLLGVFVASSGIGKLSAQSTDSEEVEPDAGRSPPCLICDVESDACVPCARHRENELLQSAKQYGPYSSLDSFLTSVNQFTAKKSHAVLSREGGSIVSSLLVTSYISSDDSHSAFLYYSETATGLLAAFAVEYADKVAQYAYYLNNGTITQALPPYPAITSTATQDSLAAPLQQGAQSPLAADSSDTCVLGCTAACVAASLVICTAKGVSKWCLPLAAVPEVGIGLAAACAAVVGYNCGGSAAHCTQECDGWCNCLGKPPCGITLDSCCEVCEECTSDGCVPIQCPVGYSCNSTNSTCTCDNFCVNTCCSAGQICANNQCVTSSTCPPDVPGAGSCPSGAVCCENPTTQQWGCGYVGGLCCSNGASCPAGTTCCVDGNSAACCTSGQVCCIPGGNLSVFCTSAGSSC